MKPLLIALAALLVAALCVAGWQHHQVGSLTTKLTKAQTQAITAQLDASVAELGERTVTKFVDRVTVVHDATTTLQMKVPTYVTPTTDAAFPLTVGFVRVHDAAARLSELPPPGPADASPSTVAASTASAIIVGNYGTCHETAEQLTALQDWVREREALQDGAP